MVLFENGRSETDVGLKTVNRALAANLTRTPSDQLDRRTVGLNLSRDRLDRGFELFWLER